MKFVTILKAVTKNWIRSRAGLFFSILFPILLLLVFGAIFGGQGGTSASRIFVQNLDRNPDGTQTSLSTGFIQALNSTKILAIVDVPTDADAKSYARDQLGPLGGNLRILQVAKRFQDDLVNGTLKVQVGISYNTLNMTYQMFAPYLNDTQKAAYQQGLQALQQLNDTLPRGRTSLTLMLDASDQSAQIIKNIVLNVAGAFNYQLIGAQNVIDYKEEPVTSTSHTGVDYYIPGITAAFIMTNGLIGLTSNTTEFKRRGIIKRLSITPLTKTDWIVGNVLSQTVLNIILALIMIAFGWIVFNVRIIPDAYALTLIFLGSVMFSGMGMILSGLVKDVEAASAIGNAIAFPMMFLSGTYFPLEFMPSYLQTVATRCP